MLPRQKLTDIAPIAFCRQIKSLMTGMPVEQVIMCEGERGTFKEYCLILSRALRVPLKTIQTKWGPGIEFPNMPKRLQKLLNYVLYYYADQFRANIAA